MLHPQAAALVAGMAASGAPPFWTTSVANVRAQMSRLKALLAAGPVMVGVKAVKIPGLGGNIAARLYLPIEQPQGLIVFFHGGGWVFGELDDADATCRALALKSGLAVLSADYRLAPEHRFPAAIEDAIAVVQWASSADLSFASSSCLFVAGESAGGNLAAAVTQHFAHDPASLVRISGQVLIYPVMSPFFDTPSYIENADGPTIGRDAMMWFWDQYVPDVDQRMDPRASPLLSTDHSRLPPTLIVTAGYDPLRSEDEAYAKALSDAGVAVTSSHFGGMPHGFFSLYGLLDDAKIAVEQVGEWLAKFSVI